ncbi:trehalase family glycosidase [Coraliomargarita sp. SDUM461003]|uniref:Trehalase family glycosidase n=1 Tax=Thalassobacterium maritimum TaxID=3041265 RepID=A0ABU1AQ58_9BACT|nr:trehalase family glycosidase [Coraliomargarita sp. SDUM461003]MDQ8206299.1 trehalase family glycosidase [Coraliomargarita sp. SDUM461003]
MDYTLFERPQWNSGQMIAFSGLDGKTDYTQGLVARTSLSPTGIEIVDPGKLSIAFKGKLTGPVIFGGDFFAVETEAGPVRGVVLDAFHILIEGAAEVISHEDYIQYQEADGRLLVGTATTFDASLITADLEDAFLARSEWIRTRELPTDLSPERLRTVVRALTAMKSQILSPEGKITHRWTTPDRWPHKDMWLWDTAFHAIGWRHIDPALAMEMIDAMFDLQREDGFLTYRGTPEGPYFHLGDLLSQPPVLAIAVKLVHEVTKDDTWLKNIYPKLCAYLEWDLANRDLDGGGLVEWFIEDNEECRSGESGMDNSPRFDDAVALDAVDFNAYLASEYQVIAAFATQLGLSDDADKWNARASNFCSLIEGKLWSETEQFYCDLNPATDQQTAVLASSGFMPLLCGAPSQKRAEALEQNLFDPQRFGTALPVASVAVCDSEHYEKDMWRGPTWISINWLIAKGFERYGMENCFRSIRDRSVEEIEAKAEKYGTFFEYFDDRCEIDPPKLSRKGVCAPEISPYKQVIHEFGWSFTLYIDMVYSTQLDHA